MTTLPQGRAPPQPQPKAPSTVQSSRLAAVANHDGSRPSSRAQSRVRQAKPRQEANIAAADFASETATLSLIRRVLISDKSVNLDPHASPKPVDDILPPLTSSNEIDVQLYAIIAIIIKDFVNTWYSNITPDHQFVEEVIQIIAHCSRTLEQRLRYTDIVELFLDEIPFLFEQHVIAYRTAVATAQDYSYGSDFEQSYHMLNPHPALDPFPQGHGTSTETAQQQNEAVYRQLLVSGVLAVVLPTEDLQNSPLRLLVGDILADLIIGQALAGKICEGWFMHDVVIKIIAVIKTRLEPKASGQELREEAKSRLEKFGLLHSEQNTNEASRAAGSGQSVISMWFWQILQGIFFAFMAVRFVVRGILQARNSLPRSSNHLAAENSPTGGKTMNAFSRAECSPQATITYSLYGTITTLIRFADRMPWLASAIMFLQHVLLSGPARLAAPDSILDRFLHDTIQTHILPPTLIAPVLLNLRIVLFPNNSLGPPAPPPPSSEEQVVIRRRAAESILSLVPPLIARTYFGTSDEEDMLEHIEEEILDVLGNSYLNKHLIYGILELVLCRLVPELTELNIRDLLAERGVLPSENERPDSDKSESH